MPTSTKIPPAPVARAMERIRHHVSRLHLRLAPAPIAMAELIFATWHSQAITAAAQLGVADALGAGPLAKDELARQIDADPDALARLMRLLISRGIFRQRRDGRYALNARAETLRSEAQISMRGAALYFGSRQHREHWTMLAESVRTGEPSIPRLRGKGFFDYLGDDAEFAELFNNAMTSTAEMLEAALVAAYDFSRFRLIADIGGGHGQLLSTILAETPDARGVLFDLPEAVAGAPPLLAKLGVSQRVTVKGGSFLDSVPAGADAYVLKNVIHDWPDEEASAILRNMRAVTEPGATLLLMEMVIPDHDREFMGKLADLEMLLCFGARERNEGEWRDLLQRCGFRVTQVVQTAGPLSVIEAVPG